jgi:DUF2924 family protein
MNMLARNIDNELEALSIATLAEVKEQWRNVFGTDAPTNMSRKLLIRALAHEVQARTYGRLKPKIRKQLRRVMEPCAPSVHKPGVPSLQPGTRLLREWRGICHCVDVTDDGFRWNNQTWCSLSAIARTITGTRWNGPAFFGLRKQEGMKK